MIFLLADLFPSIMSGYMDSTIYKEKNLSHTKGSKTNAVFNVGHVQFFTS